MRNLLEVVQHQHPLGVRFLGCLLSQLKLVAKHVADLLWESSSLLWVPSITPIASSAVDVVL